MAEKNPLGFGEKLSQLHRKQEGKSKALMALEREQKANILVTLRHNKTAIEERWAQARHEGEKTFTVRFDSDLSGGVLTDMEVATLIRRWTFETYENYLGLDTYHRDEIRFLVAE